ncbi:MAG: hypothetical protein Q9227_003124 [Pyrenula ochraceoflavens]
MSSVRRPPHATCEDCNEDAEVALPETRKVANVAAKRSNPKMAAMKTKGGSIDGASDSGYSSRTAGTAGTSATVPSLDSDTQKARTAIPLKLDTTFQERERRPYGSDKKPEQPREPAQSKLQRSPSKAKKTERVRHKPGSCVDCDKYGYHPPTLKPPPTPAKDVPVPASPSRGRKPPPPPPKEELTPKPSVQPRASARRSSSSYRTSSRPVSFHAGVETTPEMMYAFAPVAYDYGPPLSASAWSNTPMYSNSSHFPPSAFPSAFPSAYVATPGTPSSVRTPVAYYREPSPAREPSLTRRPSHRGPPVVQQVRASQYERPPSPRKERKDPQPSRGRAHDEDYYRMPPPPQTISLSRRSSVKKAATTTSAQVPQTAKMDEAALPQKTSRRPSEADPIQQPVQISRRPSNRKSVSYDHDPPEIRRGERPLNRRSTVYGAEQLHDLEQKQKSAEAYQRSKGTQAIPVTTEAIKQSRRTSFHSAARSESGSHRSRASSGRGSGHSASRGDKNDFTMTINGVDLGFSQDSIENKNIHIKPKQSGAMSLLIGGKKSRRSSVARIERAPSDGHNENVFRDNDRDERASRKSSRSGRSGK